jgi:pimeloyl-ACP methyl ester carboxylesterase
VSARVGTGVVAILAMLVALVVVADDLRTTVLTEKPLVATIHPVKDPVGLMVTSGGWAYCEQMRPVARRTSYTLLCGRYQLDGYLGPGLRPQRHLDWGNPAYLARLAQATSALHRRVAGRLVLIGVSYSGFGVATLAAHHPELRPDRLIVIDSYFDLAARRRLLPDRHETALEIDGEVGTSPAALRRRSAGARGLARLVATGTDLTVVWSVSDDERRRFNGATCSRDASAATLALVAGVLQRPVPAWVTRSPHGRNLWRHGVRIVRGSNPGRKVLFRPGVIPAGSFCSS